MVQLLRLCSRDHEPKLLSPCEAGNCCSWHAWSLCSAIKAASAMRSPHTARKSSPYSPQLGKAHMRQQTPTTVKKKKNLKKKPTSSSWESGRWRAGRGKIKIFPGSKFSEEHGAFPRPSNLRTHSSHVPEPQIASL